MEKAKKIFIDGEVTRYTFAKGNYVSISCINTGKGWLGNLYWKIEKYKNPIFGYPSIANKHKTKNIAKLTETINLYNSIKKQKYKTEEKKLLIQALMIIIHDIKNEILIEQNLF